MKEFMRSIKRWGRNPYNKGLRFLLGFCVVGTLYIITGSIWASFVGFILYKVITS